MKAIESRLTRLEKAQRVAMPTVPVRVLFYSPDGTVREGPVFFVASTWHPAQRYGGINGK